MLGEDRELKISFISKKENVCPACGMSFRKEEMLTGGGRLIAGLLTEELHRLYEPSIKYGDVHPLVYQMLVCPECWFASMEADFPQLPQAQADAVCYDKDTRHADTLQIFPGLDYNEPRTLKEGAASYYLTMRCYDYYEKNTSPTIKQGIASIRAAWLLDELDKKFPQQHYDWLAMLFKKKANFLYNEAIRREQRGKETLSALKIFGPDTDKNYGYEGALYLTSLLRFKYSHLDNTELRIPTLEEAKRTIARIFGVGKSSKAKPGPLLEHAKNLYETISKEMNEIDFV
jgi:uncharacterized protein (DUF2225 family)